MRIFLKRMIKLGVYIQSEDVYSARHCGGVAERLKAAVLKTADGQPSESSNLSSSAIFTSSNVFQSQVNQAFQRNLTLSKPTIIFLNPYNLLPSFCIEIPYTIFLYNIGDL